MPNVKDRQTKRPNLTLASATVVALLAGAAQAAPPGAPPLPKANPTPGAVAGQPVQRQAQGQAGVSRPQGPNTMVYGAGRPGAMPGATPGMNPGMRPGAQPGMAGGARPGIQPGMAGGARPGTQPGMAPGARPAGQPGAAMQPGSTARPGAGMASPKASPVPRG